MPAPDPQQVAHNIALLLAVHLGHVLVGTHLEGLSVNLPVRRDGKSGKRKSQSVVL